MTQLSVASVDTQKPVPPSATKSNDNLDGLSHDEVLKIAVDIFVRMRPNALGKAAYKFDPDGMRYNAATTHKKYTPRSADKALLQEFCEHVSNRVPGTRRLIVIGPGPQEAFEQKEALLLRQISTIDEVVTIDLSKDFNEQAGNAVSKLSKELGRAIKHTAITMDYREAAKQYKPDEDKQTLVVTTGGTLMNTETQNTATFPAEEFISDISALKQLARAGGNILATYVSDADKDNIVEPYRTKAFADLYLSVIDVIGQTCPEFAGLSRKSFEVHSVHNPNSQAIDHYLMPKKDMDFSVSYKNGGGLMATHRIKLTPEQPLLIIPSYRPNVDMITKETYNRAKLSTTYSVSDAHGSTLQLWAAPRP